MTRQVDQGAIVDDAFVVRLTEHRSLHAVIEDLARRTAQRLKRCHVEAQDRGEVLMHDESCPDQSAEAQHHGEQPDDPRRLGLVGEDDVELREVDLRLFTGRGLEAHLEMPIRGGSHVAEEVGDCGVAALISAFPQLAEQARAGQAQIGFDAPAQIAGERV
jgi:hypothetical protein